jgi:hypothetical protein
MGPAADTKINEDGIMNSLKVWIHGLAAAAISAFASAASGAIALPSVFTFDRAGFLNMVKLATVPALLAVFAYLKSSPIPSLTVTTMVKNQ